MDGILPSGRSKAGGRQIEDLMSERHDSLRAGGAVYPAGPRLSKSEFQNAQKLAPVDDKGRPHCWDFMCYSGCKLSDVECLRVNGRVHTMAAHKSIPPPLRLAYNRLGGLRTKKSEPLQPDYIVK